MVKKLWTIFMLALMSAPLLAQTINGKRDGVMFAPQKGQWQLTLSTTKALATSSRTSPTLAVQSVSKEHRTVI